MASKKKSARRAKKVQPVVLKRRVTKTKQPFLLNWPPSRGPMPAWMRAEPEYEAPDPALLVREKKPLTDAELDEVQALLSAKAKPHKFKPIPIRPRPLVPRDEQIFCSVHVLTLSQVKLRVAGRLVSGWNEEGRSAGYALPPKPLKVVLSYPLSVTVTVTIKPYTLKHKAPLVYGSGRKMRRRVGPVKRPLMDLAYVLWQLARTYRKIYRQHKRHGVWGHALDDLWFEGLLIKRDGTAEVMVGS